MLSQVIGEGQLVGPRKRLFQPSGARSRSCPGAQDSQRQLLTEICGGGSDQGHSDVRREGKSKQRKKKTRTTEMSHFHYSDTISPDRGIATKRRQSQCQAGASETSERAHQDGSQQVTSEQKHIFTQALMHYISQLLHEHKEAVHGALLRPLPQRRHRAARIRQGQERLSPHGHSVQI